jgi:tetratricopeptide (TPR) repeat protein
VDKARAALTERDAQRAQKARAAFAAKNAERISKARSNYQQSVAANAVRAGSGANGSGSSYCYQGGNYSNCYWGGGGWGNSSCWWGGWLWGWSSYCWGSWWNSYWYSGGYWWPGNCPSYYWYGPFYPAYTSIIYQTVESDPQADVVYVYEEPQEEVYAGEPIPEGEVVVAQDWAGGTPVPAADGNLNRAADHYLTLGDQAFQESRFGDAVHFYAKAVEFSPRDGILYLILADALFATGDYHYAAYALRRAFELDSKLAMSVVDKHGFYADPLEFDRQIATLELYIQDHFLDDDARLVLAANYLFGGRPAASVELLENAFSREILAEPAGAALLEAAKRIQYGASTRGN